MLVGNKIILERLDEKHLDKTLACINNPEIFITMGVLGPRTKQAQDQWFDRIHNSISNIVFAICIKETGEHIGNASIFDVDYRNSNAGLTIFFAESKNRGQGYGTETVNLLCEYAFNYLNLHKVYCKTDNPIAEKLYSSVGFDKEGVFKEHAYHYGNYIDKVCFGLIKEKFMANQNNKFK